MKSKHDNEYEDSFDKRSKKKRKKEKKKRRKEARKSKHKSSDNNSGSSSDSEGNEQYTWIEKTTEPTHPVATDKTDTTELTKLQREEWMNLNSLFPCVSKSEEKNKKLSSQKKNESIFDKPGQSKRELNPYWKDGGTGLPQTEEEKPNVELPMDVNWLKKSLQRAKERALEEGRSLEEVAAERWGSLETIQSMIQEAEAKQYRDNTEQSWKRNRYESNKNYSIERRNETSKYDRENPSKSTFMRPDFKRDSERRDYLSHGKRESYKRPREETDYFTNASSKLSLNSRHARNWQKRESSNDTIDHRVEKHESNERRIKLAQDTIMSPDVKDIEKSNVQSNNDVNIKSDDTEPKILTEAEMNKLGARIIKAEMMGQDELAAELKIQLEEARKAQVQKINAENTVILTKTDAKGIARPIQQRNEHANLSKQKKKKIVETHSSRERIRYYADDDKYSLQELFQQEKGTTTNNDDAVFTKIMSKNMEMSDIFEQQISQAGLDARQDKQERNTAIKEHQRVSKSIEDCRWCIDSRNMLKHMIITMDSEICLSLPSHVSLTDGHCVLTPVQHTACQLHLDENVWEKLMTFKKKLNTMFADQNLFPIYFETYKNRHKYPHMQVECVPVPKDVSNSVPMYFKKALLECETEWSTNKKIIELYDKNLRQAVPNGLAYFAVEFGLRGGYAHVIEDERMFPANFAQETIAGILELDYDTWRKPRKENFDQQKGKVMRFTKMWEKWNKTRE